MNLAEDIFGIPSPARNKPEVFPDLVEVYYSFHLLMSCRGNAMGAPQPITIQDMLIIYQEFGFSGLLSFRSYMQYILALTAKADEIALKKRPK